MNSKRFSIIFFSVIAVAILSVFVTTLVVKNKKNEITHAKTIVPTEKNKVEDSSTSELYANSEFENISLIQLSIDETLISTLSIDFNNDSYEDQIIAIKKTSNPYIIVVFGIYNQKKSEYERVLEVQTTISQVKTFNLISMDLIGDHSNAFIFTGFDENNDSILQAYIYRARKIVKIADFKANTSIFIQQTTRSDDYSIYGERGESFPIIVSTTEENSDGTNFDQIQKTFNWNEKAKTYTETSSTRVSSKRLASKELARILDGTVPTFLSFLDGLWYKTGSDKTEYYILFDPENNEIIFYNNDTQEVYDWLNNSIRRYGIFFSASNKSISNLVRHFNISLVSTDEIRIKITDDVRMIIGTEAVWDGVYKKVVQKKSATDITRETQNTQICKTLVEGLGRWNFQNNSVYFNGDTFTIFSDEKNQTGSFNALTLYGTNLLEFHADDKNCPLNGFFTYKKNDERIDLVQVKITTSSCVSLGKNPIRLEKYKTN